MPCIMISQFFSEHNFKYNRKIKLTPFKFYYTDFQPHFNLCCNTVHTNIKRYQNSYISLIIKKYSGVLLGYISNLFINSDKHITFRYILLL